MEYCSIAAVIILFNPEINRLQENVNAVLSQVDFVVMVDNASENINDVKKIYNNKGEIYFIYNKENVGIARALNQGIEFCKKKGAVWALTLDQDSVIPVNMISEYSKYILNSNNALISCIIHDRNETEAKKTADSVEEINQCITSGALTRITAWDKCGKFDEKLFIDNVDFEFCYRLIWQGFHIIRVNSVELLHECGKIKEKKIFKAKIIVYNHSAQRKYYIARNWIYTYLKHKPMINLSYIIAKEVEEFGKVLLFEKNKKKKMKAFFEGVMDGWSGKMGKKELEEKI